VLAIVVNQTITLGTIILGALMGTAGISTYFYGVRYKSAYEVERASSASLREGREAYQLQAERFRDDAKEQRALKHAALSELAAERLKTDLTSVVKGFHEQHVQLMAELKVGRETIVVQVVGQLQAQEERHMQRHQEILESLQQIAEHIGHTNGHAT
jgi:hypothetical protein